MIATLNGMLDELDCMKRIIEIKSTLIEFPGKIISTKEINDIKSYFKDFEKKIESYFRSFLSEKEKEAKSKKPKTLEQKERFKEIETLFDKVKTTEKVILSKAKTLFEEYSKREKELFSGQIIPRKIKVILNDGRNNNNNIVLTENSDPAEPQKEEYLIVEKVFLNSKVSINEIDVLKKRNTLDEERIFLMQLFNLKELFENSQSKQFIMLDYYMNLEKQGNYSNCVVSST